MTVAERVVVGKVLAMAVVGREAAMDLETLEQEVAAERAQDLLSIFPDQTREAKALALPWRGQGHSTCCQQDAVRCRHKQTPNLAVSTLFIPPAGFRCPPCSPPPLCSRIAGRPDGEVIVVGGGGGKATGRPQTSAPRWPRAPAFWCAHGRMGRHRRLHHASNIPAARDVLPDWRW